MTTRTMKPTYAALERRIRDLEKDRAFLLELLDELLARLDKFTSALERAAKAAKANQQRRV